MNRQGTMWSPRIKAPELIFRDVSRPWDVGNGMPRGSSTGKSPPGRRCQENWCTHEELTHAWRTNARRVHVHAENGQIDVERIFPAGMGRGLTSIGGRCMEAPSRNAHAAGKKNEEEFFYWDVSWLWYRIRIWKTLILFILLSEIYRKLHLMLQIENK